MVRRALESLGQWLDSPVIGWHLLIAMLILLGLIGLASDQAKWEAIRWVEQRFRR